MSGLMRTHTITLYNSLGEVDRRAAYLRTVIEGVRIDASHATIETVSGPNSDDKAVIFIPGATPGYVVHRDWSGEGWTLAEGDLVVVGECTLEIPGSTIGELEAAFEVYRISSWAVYNRASSRFHHFEVGCR